MNVSDRVVTIFLLVTGVYTCFESLGLSLGSLGNPGAGFLPFILGTSLICLSIILLLRSKKETKASNESTPRVKDWRRRVIYVVIVMLGYVLLLEPLGFVLCSLLLMGFLMRALEPQKWLAVIIVAVGITITTYFLFIRWLHVPLPRGFFGI